MKILKTHTFEDKSGLLDKMAAVRFTPEELQRLKNTGIYPISEPEYLEQNVMPHTTNKKRDIKSMVGQLTLPKIVIPKAKNVITLNGHEYYLIDVWEPQPKANPEGSIILLDLATGRPVMLPLTPNLETLQQMKRANAQVVLERNVEKLRRYNKAVQNVGNTVSPTTWPWVLKWAEDTVQERLDDVNGIISASESEKADLERKAAEFATVVERLKADIMAGRITDRADLIDTLTFIRIEDPQFVSEVLAGTQAQSTVDEEIRSKVRGLSQLQDDAKAKEIADRARKEQEAAQKRQVPEMIPLQPFEPIGETELSSAGRYSKAVQYFSLKMAIASESATILSETNTKARLQGVAEKLKALKDFILGLAQGERAKAFLKDTEKGVEIVTQVRAYRHELAKFFADYQTEIFTFNPTTRQLEVNKSTLGKSGPGNSEVNMAVSQVIGILDTAMESLRPAEVTTLPA
jgi:hypothetical protein